MRRIVVGLVAWLAVPSLCLAGPVSKDLELIAPGVIAVPEQLLSPAEAAEGLQRLPDEIVNGLLDWEPSSVGLFLNGGSTCTGTLIGCRTFLTAAHCVCTDANGNDLTGGACRKRDDLLDPSNKAVFFQHIGFASVSSISVHPQYEFGEGHDLAVVHLAFAVPGIRPSRINETRKPAFDTVGLAVGFGRSGGEKQDAGLKQSGLVTIDQCLFVPGSTHLCWSFSDPLGDPGVHSSTCQGDSGGPLFVDFGSGLRIAGVTSGGLGECLPPNNPWDADVYLDRSWIRSTAGSDLHRETCTALPFAGETRAPFGFAAADLSAATREVSYEVEVPSNTGLLAVTLNGTGATLDADLYVRRGSSPTTGTYDCKSDSPLSLESCIVLDPQPGTWHLMARRNWGEGTFQITATMFEKQSGSGGGGGDTSPCIPGEFTLCAIGGRFEITATAPRSLFPGLAGRVSPVIDADLGGAFHFFMAEKNFHTVVKIALRPSGFYAVSAVALDPLEWTVRIRDTQTGEVKTYTNAEGALGVPTDTQAFPKDP